MRYSVAAGVLPEDQLLFETLMSFPRFTHEMASVSEACVEFLKDDPLKKALLDASESGDYRDVMSFCRSPCISVHFPADNLPSLTTLLNDTLAGSFTLSFHTSRLMKGTGYSGGAWGVLNVSG